MEENDIKLLQDRGYHNYYGSGVWACCLYGKRICVEDAPDGGCVVSVIDEDDSMQSRERFRHAQIDGAPLKELLDCVEKVTRMWYGPDREYAGVGYLDELLGDIVDGGWELHLGRAGAVKCVTLAPPEGSAMSHEGAMNAFIGRSLSDLLYGVVLVAGSPKARRRNNEKEVKHG